MNKIVSLFLACFFGIATLASCLPPRDRLHPSPADDGIEHITNKYGIPPERVLELATLLGVNPEDIPAPATLDEDLPFPLAYFEQQMEAFTKVKGHPPTRAEVGQIVRGYVALCEGTQFYDRYFFYSTDIDPELFKWQEQEFAVVMLVQYWGTLGESDAREDYLFADIENIDYSDDEYNFMGNFDTNQCIRDYFEEQGLPTPTPRP